MSVELYSNGASTTITEDLDASETGVDVTSASGFPTTGNFRVLVDSEIMIVTGVSGSTFTVIRGAEGTTAATHTNGATIAHVLTRDSQHAVFSHLWGCGFRQQLAGSDWTWVNQGSATLTDSGAGVLSLVVPTSSSANLRILKKAAPSTPYTITAVMNGLGWNGGTSSYWGIGWRQSSDGKLVLLTQRYDGQFFVYKYTNPTTYSAAYTQLTTVSMMGGGNAPLVYRIEDDGANRKTYLSPNGIDFLLWHTVSRTDFLTADEVCFYGNCQSSNVGPIVTLYAWEEA